MHSALAESGIRSIDEYAASSLCSPGYLNFAAIGPLTAPALRARREAEEVLSSEPERLDELDLAAERGRLTAAALLGFDDEHVALGPNTSTGLFQAAFAVPSGAVLVSPFDFPANTAPWRRAAEQGRITIRWMADSKGPRPHVTPELVAAGLTPDTVAVTISAVDFATGECVDLAGIRDAIGDRILVVDAIQGFGAADLPWSVADVIASGGQKWIRAGWGCGVLACSDRALERLGPGLSGWSGVRGADDPSALDLLPEPRADVGRFTITPPDMVAMASFAAAVDPLAVIGMTAVSARIRSLVERLRSGLAEAGAHVLGDLDPARCSGITSFALPGHDPGAVVGRLGRIGTTVAERQGHVRVSIHVSTTADAVDQMLAELKALARDDRVG